MCSLENKEILSGIDEAFAKFNNAIKSLELKFEKLNLSSTNQKSLESLDNASKTSSGYDDNMPDGEDNDVLIISDDEDYDELWETTSNSSCVTDLGSNCGLPRDLVLKCLRENSARRFFRILKTLPFYYPSEKIKSFKDDNFSNKSLSTLNDLMKSYLDSCKNTLNQDNIHAIFKTLLEIEDITCLSEYPALAQKDAVLVRYEKDQYYVNLQNVSNIEDIITPFMDEIILIPKASSIISEAIPQKHSIDLLLPHPHEMERNEKLRRRVVPIREISKDRVFFRCSKKDAFSAEQIEKFPCTKYDIIIRPSRLPMRYQHRALELLENNEEIREYLFPQKNPFKDEQFVPKLVLNLFNSTISNNPEQLEAVQYIVEMPNNYAPFIIFGPPGTGKTTTVVESILQLRLHKPSTRILVTAGSNSACDTIALRLCKYFKENSNTLQQLNTLNPDQKSIIRIFSKAVFRKGLKQIDKELLDNSNCHQGIHYYPSVKEIENYSIIVATLCTVGKLITDGMNFFSHIFIDEAAASTEPEALVGIMGIKTDQCRVILSGDHKQLGPVVKSERAIKLGLQKSLMERLSENTCYAMDANGNYDRTLQARLKRNYRSHPEIVRLYNHLYYNHELLAVAKTEDINMAAKWSKLPNPDFPIIFQAVHGTTTKDDISPSSCNQLEIQVLLWFLNRLLNDGIDGKRVQQSDIGIITPYRLQSKHIQQRLSNRGWYNVEAGSVETFQGREKQIIIVSLVKSFVSLGFLKNPKRLNVILSRPKSLLIIIGNPLTLRHNDDFNFIMQECKRHGTFLRKKKIKKHKPKKLA